MSRQLAILALITFQQVLIQSESGPWITQTDPLPNDANAELIFKRNLSSFEPFVHVLGNPCRGSPTPAAFETEDVFNVTGREMEIRIFAGHALAVIRNIKRMMASVECEAFNLNSLPRRPDISSNDVSMASSSLRGLYKVFYALAAHLHVMQIDWEEGRSCFKERSVIDADDVAQKVNRLKNNILSGMCFLIVPSDPHPEAAPYPSPDMIRAHEISLDNELTHFHDCSGRFIRDCVLLAYTRNLLEDVFHVFSFLSA